MLLTKPSKYKNELGTINSDRGIEIHNFIMKENANNIYEVSCYISDFAELKELEQEQIHSVIISSLNHTINKQKNQANMLANSIREFLSGKHTSVSELQNALDLYIKNDIY